MKIKNMLNADEFVYEGQINNEVSMTIPDQSMTLRELMIRYAKGLPLEGIRTPIWEGEEGYEVDPKTLDLAELEQLANKAREELKDIEERVKEDIKKSKKKQFQDVEEVKTDISERGAEF